MPPMSFLYTPLLAVVMSCALAACTAPASSSIPASARPAGHAPLEWTGTYRGTLPCADCAGIETTVVLAANGRYRSQMRYLGKPVAPFNEQGAFTWNADGDVVLLQGAGEPTRYLVERDQLVRLTLTGRRVQGPLAAHFVLKKLVDPASAAR